MFMNRVRASVLITGSLTMAALTAGCPTGGQPGQPEQPVNPEVTRALREGFDRGLELARANPGTATDAVCEGQNWNFDLLSLSVDPVILAEIPAVRKAGCYVGHGSYVMGWTLKSKGRRTNAYCTTYVREIINPIVRLYADRDLTAEESALVVGACRKGYNDGHRTEAEL